jgi:hypothetical protein
MADIPPPPPPPSDAPPPPSMMPPPYQGLPPGYQPPSMPPGSPGYMPQPIGPIVGLGIGAQLLGARSSIIVGLIGVVVPIVWLIASSGGSVFYFYLLPIFGIVYGVRATMRGFVIGGIIGIALNIVAGAISLLASGVI